MMDNMILQKFPAMYIWEDRMLYIGNLPNDSKCYSSSVFLFGLSLKGEITLKNNQQEVVKCTSFLIPPKIPHQMLCPPNTPMVWMQIEPIHKDCMLLQRQMRHMVGEYYIDFCNAEESKQYFIKLYQQKPNSDDAYKQQSEALNLSNMDDNPYTIRDMRIFKVMEDINNNLFDNVLTQDLANNVGLSNGRMQRLFKEQVQMSVRQYRLWKRLKYASKISFKRSSFFEVAIESGFSDASHFSRAFHQQFGKPASSMLGKANGAVLIDP